MRSNDRWGYLTGHNGTWLLISDTCFDPKIWHLSLQSPFSLGLSFDDHVLSWSRMSRAVLLKFVIFFLGGSYLLCFVSTHVIYFFLFLPWVKCKPLRWSACRLKFLTSDNPVALSSRRSSSRIIKESIRYQPNPLTRRTINLLAWRWFY